MAEAVAGDFYPDLPESDGASRWDDILGAFCPANSRSRGHSLPMLEYLITYHLDAVVFLVLVTAVAVLVRCSFPGDNHSSKNPAPLALASAAFVVFAIFATEHFGKSARIAFERSAESFAEFCSVQLEGMGHDLLEVKTTPDDPRHVEISEAVNAWKGIYHNFADIYIYRRMPDGSLVLLIDEWPALHPKIKHDRPQEDYSQPHARFHIADESYLRAEADEVVFEPRIISDERGRWVRLLHPLHDKGGQVEAILGIDMPAADWLGVQANARAGSFCWFLVLYLLLTAAFYGSRWQAQRRKQKEDDTKLRESENRFRSLFENVPNIAVQGYDRNRCVIFWNDASAALYGYSRQEALGRSLEDLIIPTEIKAGVVAAIEQWSNGGAPIPAGELVLQRKDGSPVAVFSSHVMQKNSRSESEMYCVDVDLTERNRALEALRASGEQYRRLFELMPLPMWVYDLETLRFVAVNDLAIRRYGYSRSEFEAMTLADLLIEEDVPKLHEFIKHLPDGEAHQTSGWQHRLKSGRLIMVEVTSHAFPWAARRARILVANDITDRMLAERRIFEQAQLLEKTTDAFVVTDLEHRVTFWNRGAEKLFGATSAAMLGHRMEDVLPIDLTATDTAAYFTASRKCMDDWRGELKLTGPDGNPVFIETHVTLIRDDSCKPTGRMAISRDLTKRKNLEAQFLQVQKMEVIGRLAGGVAHDFNSILMAMMLTLDLLEQDVKNNVPATRSVGNIRAMADRASSLTEQLLLFARKQSIKRKALDLNVALLNVVKMIERLIGADIKLSFSLSEEPLWVQVDMGMLDQLVMNLCINARDAMPRGGKMTLTTSLETFDEASFADSAEGRPGTFVCLSISDTGQGMTPDVLTHIFEPFFTTKRPGVGTGLGLASVQGIVHQHKGWVTVKSVVGQGSTFKVYLENVAAAEPAPEVEKGDVELGAETVLLVEDDIGLRNACMASLLRWGYNVRTATSGPEAFDLWRKDPSGVDIVLTDIVMPGGMSGRELGEKIRSLQPSAKIILMTGFNHGTGIANAPQGGMEFRYVEKPVRMTVLAEVIRNYLNTKP